MEMIKCPLCGSALYGRERISVRIGFKKKHTNRFMHEKLEAAGMSFEFKNDIFYFSCSPREFLYLIKSDYWFKEVFIFQKPDIFRFVNMRCNCLKTFWPSDPRRKSWKY